MRFILFLINLIFIVLLLLSYSAAYVSPDGSLWWLQLIGMAYGFLLIINALFVIVWLLFFSRRFLWSLAVILLGYGRFFGVFQPALGSDKVEQHAQEIKFMSFNVRLFDLYNWFHNTETRKKIFDFLKDESPDIVCFQEYYHSDGADVNTANNDAVMKVIPSKYSHIEYSKTLHKYDHWGMATFSKYPIINKQRVKYNQNDKDIFIYSDIVALKDTFRVINAHLESIHFKVEDYKYLEKIENDVDREDIKGGIKILKSMKRAFKYRVSQIKVLKKAIAESPYPVILCGDFNDTPSSYTYHQLLAGRLKDAYRETGRGFGNTYVGPFPSFRIDYILHDPKIKASQYTTHRIKLSDHYPISCVISLK